MKSLTPSLHPSPVCRETSNPSAVQLITICGPLLDDIIAVSQYVSINNLAGCIYFFKLTFFTSEFLALTHCGIEAVVFCFFFPGSEVLTLGVRVYTTVPLHPSRPHPPLPQSPDGELPWRRPTQPCSNLCGLQGRDPPGSHFLSSCTAIGCRPGPPMSLSCSGITREGEVGGGRGG